MKNELAIIAEVKGQFIVQRRWFAAQLSVHDNRRAAYQVFADAN